MSGLVALPGSPHGPRAGRRNILTDGPNLDPASMAGLLTVGGALPAQPGPRGGSVGSPFGSSRTKPRQVSQVAGSAPGPHSQLAQTPNPSIRKTGSQTTRKIPDGVHKTRPPTNNKVGEWEMLFELDFHPYYGPKEVDLVLRDLAAGDPSDSSVAGSTGARARALTAY